MPANRGSARTSATGYQTQALGAVFVAGFEEELESDANAEQRQVEISQ
jgi:hypothetical protein